MAKGWTEVSDKQKKMDLFDSVARVGKAVGNGKRLELLDLLAQGERSVEHLAEAAGSRLSTVSAHLQVLREAGLVRTRREGTRIFYALAGDEVADFYVVLRSIAANNDARVRRARDEYLGIGPEGVDREKEEVDREQLLQRVRAGEVTVLDVRPGEEYRAGHIPGAVSVPVDQLEQRLAEIPADREVVAYCRGAYCVFAYQAVDLLRSEGLRARRLEDGMLEWRLSGLPVESAEARAGTRDDL